MLKINSNIHSGAYFGVLVLLAISIPLSKFMMSISEFMLLFLWLLSGFSFQISKRFFKLGGFIKGPLHFIKYFFTLIYTNIIDKFGLFFKNKAGVAFSLIYILHIIGTIYSSDLDYSIKELRIKVPLILFPVIFTTMEKLDYRKFKILMLFYVASVFSGTMISLWFLLQKNFIDIREISPFISSIRFGLNVSFSFFILLYFVFVDKKINNYLRILFGLISIWFFVFIILLESVTSFVIIVTVSLGYLIWQLYLAKKIIYKFILVIIVVVVPMGIIIKVFNIIDYATTAPLLDFNDLDDKTSRGNFYIHDTIDHAIEDGRYVGLYLCEVEMKEAWNERSSLKFNGQANAGNSIREGLIRYMTSLDLRKDFDGVIALSDWDILMIENGCANINYIKNPGFKTRILKIIKGYEVYKVTSNPSGSSVMQRIEYLKASIAVIKENWLIGVGTGDLEQTLYKKYDEMGTKLKEEFRYHAHNQYFAIMIAFGMLGFIVFIFALIYPALRTNSFKDYFFTIFFLIMAISMLSDDTLETQAGVTLFAYFYALLMFGKTRANV